MHQYLKEKTKKHNYLKFWLVIPSCLILLFVFLDNDFPIEFQKAYLVKASSETIKINGFGIISPRKKNIISAPDDGRLIQLNVRAGQQISTGDILAKIANYSLEQSFQEATYELASLKSDISLRKSDLLMKKYSLEDNISSSETVIRKLSLELEANKQLAFKGIVSKILYEQAIMSFEQAKQEKQSAEKKLELFNMSYIDQIEALTAKTKASDNKLTFLQKRIQALTIRSNVTGIVREANINQGQMIKQGNELFELIELEQFIAKIQVPQYSSSKLALNQKATLITPNGNLDMSVEYIDTIIRKGSISVYLTFSDEIPEWIKIDQSIEAEIETVELKERLFIKKDKFYDELDHWLIYKLTERNTAIRTDIKIIDESKDRLFLKGLNVGDTIFLLPKALGENNEYDLSEDHINE